MQMLFMDISLAVNTIIPQHLHKWVYLCNWLLDCLTRAQFVWAGKKCL